MTTISSNLIVPRPTHTHTHINVHTWKVPIENTDFVYILWHSVYSQNIQNIHRWNLSLTLSVNQCFVCLWSSLHEHIYVQLLYINNIMFMRKQFPLMKWVWNIIFFFLMWKILRNILKKYIILLFSGIKLM